MEGEGEHHVVGDVFAVFAHADGADVFAFCDSAGI